MDRISAFGFVTNPLTGKRAFVDENLATGVNGTDVNSVWLQGVQDEPLAVIEHAGIVPSAADNTQLLQALGKLFGGTGSLQEQGWMDLPGGLVVQWGSGDTTGTGYEQPVQFPTRFPNACFVVLVCEDNAVGWLPGPPPTPTLYGVSAKTAAGFALSSVVLYGSGPAYASGIAYNYIALGA